jgi:hypothetical protein
MAGVARRKIIAKLHRYCFVASVLRPATAASRLDVGCNARAVKGSEKFELKIWKKNYTFAVLKNLE